MIGSALPLIRLVSALLALVCFVTVLVTMRANGVLLLGTGAVAVLLWSFGAFTRDFWFSDDPAYARIDAELDAAERDALAPVPAASVVAGYGRMPALVQVSAVAMVWIIICGAFAVTAVVGLIVGLVLS